MSLNYSIFTIFLPSFDGSGLIRKIMTIYYCVLIFGLVGLISDPFFPVSIPLFLISPIFWLFYYINLFSQKKFLEAELDKISDVSTIPK